MSKHLYRDEINSPDDPTKMEHDFSVFEREVSSIIKKFLYDSEIMLDMDEDFKLRLFFALMGFRSKRVKDHFEKQLSGDSEQFYSRYQSNRDFEDFWKRNLSRLVCCRSIQEVLEHEEIDEPIKVFFMRDTMGITGMYFTVVERYESEEFIIGDTYPVVVTGLLPNDFPLHIYSIFPISPKRIVLMVENGAEETPREVLGFRQSILQVPKMNLNGTYRIRVKKMYAEEVKLINQKIIKEAKVGCIYKKLPIG